MKQKQAHTHTHIIIVVIYIFSINIVIYASFLVENSKTIVWNVLFSWLAAFDIALNCLYACISACACAVCTYMCSVYCVYLFHKLHSFKSILFSYTLTYVCSCCWSIPITNLKMSTTLLVVLVGHFSCCGRCRCCYCHSCCRCRCRLCYAIH